MKKIFFAIIVALASLISYSQGLPESTKMYYLNANGDLKEATIKEYVDAGGDLSTTHKAVVNGVTVAATDAAVDTYPSFFGQSTVNQSGSFQSKSDGPGKTVLYKSVDKSPLSKRIVERTQDENGTIYDNSKTKGLLPTLHAVATGVTDTDITLAGIQDVGSRLGIGGKFFSRGRYVYGSMYPGLYPGLGNFGIRDALTGGLVGY